MSFQSNFTQFLSDSEAGDADMTQKERDDIQEAINQSKETASLEKQQREMEKSFTENVTNSDDTIEEIVKEKPTTKQWFKRSKTSTGSKNENELSTQELKITFQDILEVSGKSLDIVYHAPLYDLPMVTDPHYKGYSIKQKTKWLFNYYSKVEKLRTQLAKQSLFRAPYPKPILPSTKFKNSLLKNGLDEENGTFDDFFEQSDQQEELYISRGGRQLKRKIYTEDAEVDSNDSDFASFSKKNKIGDSTTKITMDTPYKPEENHSEDKLKAVKTRKDTPRRPSSLSVLKSIRSEAMFEKLLEDEEKRKQQQKERENFEKTLPSFDENDEDELLKQDSPPADVVENDDDDFVRKRVSPPLLFKKGGRGRKAVKQDNEKHDKKLETPASPVLKRYTNLKSAENRFRTKTNTQKLQDNIQVEEDSAKTPKTPCPICNREFPQNVIENHASTCGDDQPNQSFADISENPRANTHMTCELCDKVCLEATEYETHMKHCIAARVTEM